MVNVPFWASILHAGKELHLKKKIILIVWVCGLTHPLTFPVWLFLFCVVTFYLAILFGLLKCYKKASQLIQDHTNSIIEE